MQNIASRKIFRHFLHAKFSRLRRRFFLVKFEIILHLWVIQKAKPV